MPKLFVDTGAFSAVADGSDAHHSKAVGVYSARAGDGDLVTTDHVVVETWLLLRARLGRAAAMRWWDGVSMGVVRVLGVQSVDFARARQIGRAWPDQEFSLVDLTSFAVAERHGLVEVFAFDRHFRVYRFGAGRTRAFHVIP